MGMAAEPQFHVLAVDDSIIDRKLIERLLKTSSYQVTTVDSGSKALEFLGLQEDQQPSVCPVNHQEVEINLIITDYCMPGMTGYDLLKKVKESTSFRNIPVVIMSSENVPSRITRCLEEGAEEFFLKPVRLSDVNRLRPHMLRAKYGQDQQQNMLEECQKPEQKPPPQQQQKAGQQLQIPQELQSEQQIISEQLKQTQPQQLRDPGQQTEQQQLKQSLPQQLQGPGPQTEQQQPQQRQQHQQPHQQQLQQQQQNNNKRKSIEEGLSPDRTRPRYNSLTTVI